MGETNLYNVLDGVAGRDGGPYLDQVEARAAEIKRAEIEGREPNLDNPPATAGQPLVTSDQLVRQHGTSNIPSQENSRVQAEALDTLAVEGRLPIEPHSVRDTTEDEDTLEEKEAEGAHVNTPANSTIASENPEGVNDGDPLPPLENPLEGPND